MQINRALLRPILVAGVEKNFMVLNGAVCFALIAAMHGQFPVSLISVVVFIVLHTLFLLCAKIDPYFSLVGRGAMPFIKQSYFPAKAHVLSRATRCVPSVELP